MAGNGDNQANRRVHLRWFLLAAGCAVGATFLFYFVDKFVLCGLSELNANSIDLIKYYNYLKDACDRVSYVSAAATVFFAYNVVYSLSNSPLFTTTGVNKTGDPEAKTDGAPTLPITRGGVLPPNRELPVQFGCFCLLSFLQILGLYIYAMFALILYLGRSAYKIGNYMADSSNYRREENVGENVTKEILNEKKCEPT